jgi:hypothetical protein
MLQQMPVENFPRNIQIFINTSTLMARQRPGTAIISQHTTQEAPNGLRRKISPASGSQKMHLAQQKVDHEAVSLHEEFLA